MIGDDIGDYPIKLYKGEVVQEIKKNLKIKWKICDLSEKVEQTQEVFTEVGNRNCSGEKDRRTFSAVHQLLTGHSFLNSHNTLVNVYVDLLVLTRIARTS